MAATIVAPFLASNKYYSTASAGTVAGGDLTVLAGSFTAHQLFTVSPLSVTTRTFNITGFPAYEVQFTAPVGTNVVVDGFATDVAGNLNAAQRVLQSETTQIAALTPIP